MKKYTTHILRFSFGGEVIMHLRERDAKMNCVWHPGPPFPSQLMKQIEKEYIPWRNSIIEEWSSRTGKNVLVITC